MTVVRGRATLLEPYNDINEPIDIYSLSKKEADSSHLYDSHEAIEMCHHLLISLSQVAVSKSDISMRVGSGAIQNFANCISQVLPF
jgi:hypothetical protein